MAEGSVRSIIDGFEEDLENIFNDVRQQEDPCLEFFLDYWESNHFDCIFANRYDPRELLEAISYMNQKLIEYAVDHRRAEVDRFTALFFLLCLSIKQPSNLRRRVRLTCKDTLEIDKLCREADPKLERLKTDAVFVWMYLMQISAIDFVEERSVFGPSMLVNKGKKKPYGSFDESNEAIDEERVETKFLEEKIYNNLAELEGILPQYELIRESLNLDNYNDITVDLKSDGTLREHLNTAKSLLNVFRSEL